MNMTSNNKVRLGNCLLTSGILNQFAGAVSILAHCNEMPGSGCVKSSKFKRVDDILVKNETRYLPEFRKRGDGSATDWVLPLTRDYFHYSQSGKRAWSGLFITARDLNAFGQFWLNPVKFFSSELRKEAWTFHGMRESDGGRYGLLWWLFEDDGGYVMSGKDNKINAVVPETGVVITVIRYPQAKPTGGYKFAKDKRAWFFLLSACRRDQRNFRPFEYGRLTSSIVTLGLLTR